MGQHSVAGCSEEGFDFQVLLDPFEEQFDLPAFFVNVCDLLGLQMVGIGDEAIIDTGFLIGVRDQAERGLDAFEPDGLVVGDTGAFAPRSFEQIFNIGIALEASHKVDGVRGQVVVPGIIGKTAIKTDEGTFRKFEGSSPINLMHLAAGHIHKRRNIAVGVEPHV